MESQRVGIDLAEAVAAALEAGRVLAYNHRDYCGMGLRKAEELFLYGEVSDGILPCDSEIEDWPDIRGEERFSFAPRDEFASWLAMQSNYSLRATG